MTALLAIDPGTTESGWVVLGDGGVIAYSGVESNGEMVDRVRTWGGDMAVEMIASYGMAVGKEVFETCVWIGRFIQANLEQWQRYDGSGLEPGHDPKIVYRRDVKLHLCGNARAKDANIRQALIDLYGPPGTKGSPGPTYGVKSHAWAALGVATTVRGLR